MRNYIIIGCVTIAAMLASCTQPVTAPISQGTISNIDAYFWSIGEGAMTFVDTSDQFPATLSFSNGPNGWLQVSNGNTPNIECIVNQDSIFAFDFSSGSVFDLTAGSYFSSLDTETFDTLKLEAVVVDGSHQVIVGNDSGVYFYNFGSSSTFQQSGLQITGITSLTVNASTGGAIYAGTAAGTIYKGGPLPSSWNTYTNTSTLPKAPIGQLLSLGGDSLAAFFTGQPGIYLWDASKWAELSYLSTSQITSLGIVHISNVPYLLAATSNGTFGAYAINSLGTTVSPVSTSRTIYCFGASSSTAFAGTDDGVYQWSGPSNNSWTPIQNSNLTQYKNVTSIGVDDYNIIMLSNGTAVSASLSGSPQTRTLPKTASAAQQVGWYSSTPWVLTNHDFDTGFALTSRDSGFVTGAWPADTGGLVLMRNDLFANDSSWRAGTLVTATHNSFPITARVLAHLDSLSITANGIRLPKALSDVLMVRYSFEHPGELPESNTIPYWIIYYAKNVGPVMFDKVSGAGTAVTVERREIMP